MTSQLTGRNVGWPWLLVHRVVCILTYWVVRSLLWLLASIVVTIFSYFSKNDNFSVALGAWIPLPWQPKAGTHTVVFLCIQSYNISNQSCII